MLPASHNSYYFSDEINLRVTKHLGQPLPINAEIRKVRDVAPSKDQYCVSFILPTDILLQTECLDDFREPVSKKLKANA